jgi:hypothetical protein
MRLPPSFALMLVASMATMSCAGGSPVPPAPSPPTAAPPPTTAVVQKPLETVTITVRADGFHLDSATAAVFAIDALRVYQGSRLTFVNQDNVPHDIQSNPPHIHTDCPEIGGAGFLVPGQTKSTAPLDRLVTCGFHDHHHEDDPRFSGRVTVEQR